MRKTNLIWVGLIIVMTFCAVKDPFHSRTLNLLLQCYGISLTFFFFFHRRRTFPYTKKLFNRILQVLNPHILRLHRVLKNIEKAGLMPFSLSSLIRPVQVEKLSPLAQHLKRLNLLTEDKGEEYFSLVRIRENFRKNFFDVDLPETVILENIRILFPVELHSSSLIGLEDRFFNLLNKRIFVYLLRLELVGTGQGPECPLVPTMARTMNVPTLTVLRVLWAFIQLKEDPSSLERVVHKMKDQGLPDFTFLQVQKSHRSLEQIFFAEGKMAHRIHFIRSLDKYLQLVEMVLRFHRNEIPSAQTLNECYKMLQCDSHNSEGTIKKRFNKLALQYHPDRLEAANKSMEKLKKANSLFGKLNDAYQTVKKSRQNLKKIRQLID